MNMNKCVKRLALGMALGGASMGAMAFTDGVLSTISTGTCDIRLILGMKARVWGLQDLLFTTANVGDNANANFCVYSGSERVFVTMAGEFELTDSASSPSPRMDYIVKLRGVGPGNGVIGAGGGNLGDPSKVYVG